MQASSAGLNVTLGAPAPSFGALSSLQSTISNMGSATSSLFGLYTQPTTYASTNPFLTGAYMAYNNPTDSAPYSDKFNTIGSTKDIKSFFDGYPCANSPGKYPSKLATTYEVEGAERALYSPAKYNTIGAKYQEPKAYGALYTSPKNGGVLQLSGGAFAKLSSTGGAERQRAAAGGGHAHPDQQHRDGGQQHARSGREGRGRRRGTIRLNPIAAWAPNLN
ncbi:hypothetical protein YQE_07770, partial [Dendroctonus ponderosae]